MIPVIENKYSLPAFEGVNIWPSKNKDKVLLYTDAVLSPYIELYPDFGIEGETIIYKDGKLIKVSGDRREVVADYSPKIPIDVVYKEGKFVPVYKGLKSIIFDGDKYSTYYTKYGFKLFLNGNKISIIAPNGKVVEEEKPSHYRVFGDYVSLVYNSHSLVIDRDGNVRKYNKPAVFLASTSLGNLYQTVNGRILLDSSEYDLVGVCSSDAVYLGESYSGIFISCEGKVKYFYKGGWSYFGQIESNPYSSDVNQNMVVLTNVNTVVYSYDLRKLFTLKNVFLVKLFDNKIIVVSRKNRVYIVSPYDENGLVNLEKDEIGYKVIISEVLRGEVSLGSKIVETGRKANGSLVINVEPLNLSDHVSDVIKIENEIYSYEFPITIQGEKPNLQLEELKLRLASENGRYIDDKNSNAVLQGVLRYKVKTKLDKAIGIRIRNKEVKYNLGEIEGELKFVIPFYKPDITDETIQLLLYRGGKVEEIYEVSVTPEIIRKGEVKVSTSLIEDSKLIRIRKSVNKDFIWEDIEEYPAYYDNLIVSKVGDFVEIEGNKFEVSKGIREVEIKKGNIKRKYIVIGIDNPVRIKKVEVLGGKLHVMLEKSYHDIPVSGFYGTQMFTTLSDELVFDLDPAYNELLLISNLGGLKWTNKYKLDLLRTSIRLAANNAFKLKEELETFGIL